ncbi:unnamed protein product, partial [Laminaria digitata]
HHHHRKSAGKRPRGRHPVSLHFGRADIERYICETIRGTAVTAVWAAAADENPDPYSDVGARLPPRGDVEGGGSPPKLRHALGRQVLARLNTNQRISKRDLMSADLSIVDTETSKSSSVSGSNGRGGEPASRDRPSASSSS